MPFTIGGGIRSVADAQAVLDAGADKVSVNSAALQRPELLDELAAQFGAQCVVLAIDAKARPLLATNLQFYNHGKTHLRTDTTRRRGRQCRDAPAGRPTWRAGARRRAATWWSGRARGSSAGRGRSC